MECSKINCR